MDEQERIYAQQLYDCGDERDWYKTPADYAAFLRRETKDYEDLTKQGVALQARYDALPRKKNPFASHDLPQGHQLEEELEQVNDRLTSYDHQRDFRAFCERATPDDEYWDRRSVEKYLNEHKPRLPASRNYDEEECENSYIYCGDYRDKFSSRAEQAKFVKKFETLGKAYGRLLDEEKALHKPRAKDFPSPRFGRVGSMLERTHRQLCAYSNSLEMLEYCRDIMPDEEYWNRRNAGDNHPKGRSEISLVSTEKQVDPPPETPQTRGWSSHMTDRADLPPNPEGGDFQGRYLQTKTGRGRSR